MHLTIDDNNAEPVSLSGFEDEETALKSATSIRTASGLATGYTEPFVLTAVLLTAALSALVTKAVDFAIDARSKHQQKQLTESDRAAEAAHRVKLETLLETQTQILLTLADRADGVAQLREEAAATVAPVLDAIGVGQVAAGASTPSEVELVRELAAMSGGRITSTSAHDASEFDHLT